MFCCGRVKVGLGTAVLVRCDQLSWGVVWLGMAVVERCDKLRLGLVSLGAAVMVTSA